MATKTIEVNLLVEGNVTADAHITAGGTSSQFVKGDGTLDSSTYDNYNRWDLKVNGTHYLYINSEGAVDFLEGVAIDVSYEATGKVRITHENYVTAGTVSGAGTTLNHGDTFAIPSLTYNAQGHITSTTTTNYTLPDAATATNILFTVETGNFTAVDGLNYTVSNSGSAQTMTFAAYSTYTLGAFWDVHIHAASNFTIAWTDFAPTNPTFIVGHMYRIIKDYLNTWSIFDMTEEFISANDSTITIAAGVGLINGGAFTLNQVANETITLNVAVANGGAGSSAGGLVAATNSIYVDYNTTGTNNLVMAAPILNTPDPADYMLYSDSDSGNFVKRALISTLPFTNNAGDLTGVTSSTTGQLTISNSTGPIPAFSIVTAAVVDTGTALATGDQIYDFVISLGYVESVGVTAPVINTGTATNPVIDLSLGNLSTGIGLTGASYDGTTSPVAWKVDYLTVTNIILSAGLLENPSTGDYIMYSDASDSGIVKKALISGLPFTNNAAANDGTITISAGSGLLTGGAFTTNQLANETITVNVGESNGIQVETNAVAVEYGDKTPANNVIQAATVVNGAQPTVPVATDEIIFNRNSTGLVYESKFSQIALSVFNNDLGITAPNNNTITLTAGNGLITGGAFTVDQSFNETITFTLGLPSSVSGTSTNNTSSTSHNHAITTGAVTDGGTAIPDGNDVYDFVIALGYTSNVGDLTAITVGTGLDITSGTGPIPNISVDLAEFGAIVGGVLVATTDYFIVLDGTVEKKILLKDLELSLCDNDLGWTTNTGTVTAVAGGVGLTSTGGTAPSLSLNFAELTDMTADISGTTEFILQNGTTESRKAASEIKLSAFNDDLTYGTGTVTNVTVGTGLDVSSGTTVPLITVDLSEFTNINNTTLVATDYMIVLDGTVERKIQFTNMKLGLFENDSGWTSNVGDITGVTAGNGLTGGGTANTVTLNVAAGDGSVSGNVGGLHVVADSVYVNYLDANGHTTNLVTAASIVNSPASGDYILYHDTSTNNVRRAEMGSIYSGHNHLTLTAGNGLTGTAYNGGTASTFAVGAGAGINVDASNVILDLSNVNGWTKQQYFAITSETTAVSITPNMDDDQVHIINLTGNITVNNPTNIKAGATYVFIFTQDATGGRTVAWGNYFNWPGGVAPTITAAAKAVDVVTFVAQSTTILLGTISQNFSN